MQSAEYFTRPRLPEVRPHTVHASSRQCTDLGDVYPVEMDDEATRKASLAGLSILAEASEAHLARDDTAVHMSELVSSRANNSSSSTSGLKKLGVTPADQFSAWNRANPFQGRYAIYDSAQSHSAENIEPAYPAFNEAAQVENRDPEGSGSHAKQTRSLGRRFSRTTKEKFAELKDSVNKHAPRMRRASTPHHLAGAQPPAELIPTTGYVPLSPSKRSARIHDPRNKKFRGPFGIGSSDRKDTPAPAYGNLASRPAPALIPRPAMNPPQWQHPGGEGARASAAAYRQLPQYVTDTCRTSFEEENLQSSRLRVGSLPSAADSGTDLTRMDEEDQSCKDSVGGDDDVRADGDTKMEEAEEEEPERIDFVSTGILPTEVCLQIFEYLEAIDLERAKHCGAAWEELCSRTSVWRAAYLRKFDRKIYSDPAPIQVGGAGVGRPNKPDQDWRAMYQARMELERNWRRGAQEAGKAIYLSGHTDSVYCLQFDEEKIITGSRDRTIRVWDINTFQCIRVIGGPNVRPVAGPKVLRTVDYPSFHLATASVNGTTYGNNIFHTPREWHDASILCLQYDHEILVTGSSDSDLIIWSLKDYQPLKRLKRHQGGVLDVALDAKHIISCSKDSRIIIWDRKTFAYLGELTGHRGPVNAVKLRGKLLVSASGDGIARLWDLEAMKLLKEFSAKERGLAAVEFSEDMKYVLAGGNDHITYKFSVETGEELIQYTGHTQLVRSLWLDSANSRVVSGSYDLDLRVYDFNTGAEVWRAEEWTTSWMLAAKSDYRRVVATSQDGRILVVDFGLKKGGLEDGQPIDGVGLLRGVENTSEIVFKQVRWQ